jgi:glycosyltransferase involved in cell wall biosynthesis
MHVVVAGDIGGAERLLVELGKRPDETGALHEVALITPNRALVDYLRNGGLVVHDRGPARENPLAYLYTSMGPFDVTWLTGLLAKQRIDLVHTHTFGSHVLGTRAARRAERPQVRTEHGTVHYINPSSSVFTRWSAVRTDHLVAVSEHVQRGIAKTAPRLASRMTVIRNGVDTSHWTPRARRDGPFSLAIVCRLTPWKRVDLAIRGAALAGVALTVVGGGEDRARLEAVAKSAGGQVHFVGHQADPRPFIGEASAVLSTSEEEPLGLSVLESLSMERPVIGIAEGGIPEIVHDGTTGLLVHEATPAALAEAIVRAKEQPSWCETLGARARRFVVDECSIETMCEGYARRYRALVNRP